MNFIGKISGTSSNDHKEENEQHQQPPITISPLLLSSSSSFYHHHHHHHHHHHQEQQQPFFSPLSYNDHHNHHGESSLINPMINEPNSHWTMVEVQHMFDKVVTPSDVGKLNRLVIPKQHAERYFPLDFSTSHKGLLLNFEDRNGKLWRFQYSYWNSSQSYVMTRGWSRFVKEKKLDAGDIVSFQRGVGVTAKDRLFIDWRRRINPNTPPCNLSASSDLSFLFQNHNLIHPCNPLVLQSFPARRNPNNFIFQVPNGNPSFNATSRSVYLGQGGQFGLGFDPLPPVQASTESTQHVYEKASGKKQLRLFGVNMDCHVLSEDGEDEAGCSSVDPVISLSSSSSFSTIPYLQLSSNYGREIIECDDEQSGLLLTDASAHDFNIIEESAVSNMSLDLKI